MTKIGLFLCLLTLSSCDLFNSNSEDGHIHRFHMDNVFTISGMIEYSDRDPFYYTQVFLADVSNSKVENIPDPLIVPGLFFPDVGRQTTILMGIFQWEPTPVTDAQVMVKGPLNMPEFNKTVELVHEQNGVYGDVSSQLSIHIDGEYALEVIRTDGTVYRDTTIVPPPVHYNMPDTVRIEMELIKQYGPDSWYEDAWASDTAAFEITNDIPDRVVTRNRPRLSFLLDDGYTLSDYPYGDRHPYFIEFWSYAEYTAGYFERNVYVLPKISDVSDSSIIMEDIQWAQVAQFDENLSNYHLPTYNIVGSYSSLLKNGFTWDDLPHDKQVYAVLSSFDPTHLYDMTTITKYDAEGNVVPKQESKTIGVWGSRATVYDHAILIPVRDYDPKDYGWTGDGWYWYDHYDGEL